MPVYRSFCGGLILQPLKKSPSPERGGNYGYKPGYVKNGHLSRTYVTISLKRSTREQTSSLMPSVDLASDGVYIAFSVTGEPVISYIAFSPLPYKRRFFSVALSCESPQPDVIRHPAL